MTVSLEKHFQRWGEWLQSRFPNQSFMAYTTTWTNDEGKTEDAIEIVSTLLGPNQGTALKVLKRVITWYGNPTKNPELIELQDDGPRILIMGRCELYDFDEQEADEEECTECGCHVDDCCCD